MKDLHSFEQCYKILNIQSDCSWSCVKKSYRKLIHQSHPDRLTDTKKISAATAKIKDLNTAYTQLSDYYRSNGQLPLNSQRNPVDSSDETHITETTGININEKKAKSKEQQSSNYEHQNKSKRSKITFVYNALVIVVLIIIYRNLDITNEKLSKDTETLQQHHKHKTETKQNIIKKVMQTSIKKKPIDKYFTYGTSISQVISIQGAPDRVKGSIWFYGKSEVHFVEGKVSYWFRSADFPLKVTMIKPYPKDADNKIKNKKNVLRY